MQDAKSRKKSELRKLAYCAWPPTEVTPEAAGLIKQPQLVNEQKECSLNFIYSANPAPYFTNPAVGPCPLKSACYASQHEKKIRLYAYPAQHYPHGSLSHIRGNAPRRPDLA